MKLVTTTYIQTDTLGAIYLASYVRLCIDRPKGDLFHPDLAKGDLIHPEGLTPMVFP